MSLDKAIEHGKEHRKPYRHAKAVDVTCRNHGSCPWCYGNRMFHIKKKLSAAESAENELISENFNDI